MKAQEDNNLNCKKAPMEDLNVFAPQQAPTYGLHLLERWIVLWGHYIVKWKQQQTLFEAGKEICFNNYIIMDTF